MLEPSKQYKVFFVEVDDYDRERVISGLVKTAESKVDYDEFPECREMGEVLVAGMFSTPKHTLTIELMPNEDGTVYRIEDFSEGSEED